MVYVSTGCNFTSFFCGLGKVTFLKCFYRYSTFITLPGEHTPGSLADVTPDSNGFLAFVRLVGTTYFTKHIPAFQTETPLSFFQWYYSPDKTAEQQHMQWYEDIHDKIWERITFEDQLRPSLDSVHFHWLRLLWVIDYWRQSYLNNVTLLPMDWFGWKTEDGTVQVEWDSPENVKDSIAFLTHGCGCNTGYATASCKCVKSGRLCGPGCTCTRTTERQNTQRHEGKTNVCSCMYEPKLCALQCLLQMYLKGKRVILPALYPQNLRGKFQVKSCEP